MTDKFFARVVTERIVDTKNYRYVYEGAEDRVEIKRLPLSMLGTADAIDKWETVKVYRV